MKHSFITAFILLGFVVSTVSAENNSKDIEILKTEVNSLKNRQKHLENEVGTLSSKTSNAEKKISDLSSQDKKLQSVVDSLQGVSNALAAAQRANKKELFESIGKTNELALSTESVLSSRTLWGSCGLVILLLAIIATIFAFLKKIKLGTTSIDDVRRAQEALQVVQTKMQEESVKLDNKLLAIVQKQLDASVPSANKTIGEPDHSLVVKLADEIARIETNLSKMDKSVRGYKQLVQAKDRMINNVRANGYEIISLLGREYNDGMQFQTRFVPDESLPEGKRIITGMIKMQVNYNGKMIQPAEIVVSQNI
ncbi:MAG: hypothetical protein PUJ28_05510 [Prevotellaceae bacterium]|mgnify:FL=1|nr:hypothetical protein [Prevotellaceae bacterium]